MDKNELYIELCSLIEKCESENPEERPKADEILGFLKKLRDSNYIAPEEKLVSLRRQYIEEFLVGDGFKNKGLAFDNLAHAVAKACETDGPFKTTDIYQWISVEYNRSCKSVENTIAGLIKEVRGTTAKHYLIEAVSRIKENSNFR